MGGRGGRNVPFILSKIAILDRIKRKKYSPPPLSKAMMKAREDQNPPGMVEMFHSFLSKIVGINKQILHIGHRVVVAVVEFSIYRGFEIYPRIMLLSKQLHDSHGEPTNLCKLGKRSLNKKIRA